jgi:diguanylate cyclase (GGDEF)-like protein
VLGLAWLVAQAATASGFLLAEPAAGESPLFALPLLVTMVVGSSAVFPLRGTLIGIAWTAALMAGVVAWVEPAGTLGDRTELVFAFALLGAIGLVGSAVGQSAVRHCGDAVVDRLTGVLNRRALEARAAELAAQAAATGASVAVVLGDLDHFKAINDQHGHARGDAALVEVAQRLRGRLRAFEDLHRCGGEEFAVLLAGATAADALAAAERLRAAVAGAPVAGLPLTMSFGVAASVPGEPFDPDVLRARADQALYAAKAAGRDAVRAWAPPRLRVAAAA